MRVKASKLKINAKGNNLKVNSKSESEKVKLPITVKFTAKQLVSKEVNNIT